jgi:HK97 family phage major capsid protein
MIPSFQGGLGQFVARKFGNRTDYVPLTSAGGGTMAFHRPSLLGTVGVFLRIILPILLIVGVLIALFHGPAHAAGLALAVPPVVATAEIKETIEKLNKAFGDFKAANDERIKALEKGTSPDALLVAKVEGANADISRLTIELNNLRHSQRETEIENARLVPVGSSEHQDKEEIHAKQFFSLVRNAKVENVTTEDLEKYRAYNKAQAAYFRDPRVEKVAEISAALQTGQNTSGGYWLSPETTGRVIEYLEDLSTMRSHAAVSPIGTDTYEGYYDLDEADSGWVGEQEARSNTNEPRIDGKFQFPIHEQYANPRTTQKMLDDAQNDVEGWLAKKVGSKMAKRENYAFVLGNGITQPKGFATYAAGTPSRASVAAYRVLQRINSGAAGAFAAVNPADKFIDIIVTMPSELRNGASFFMNQLTQAEVRKIKDGEGRYIFIPDFSSNPNGSILGYGIADLSDMANLAADSLSVAFANMKEGYEIKDHRVGISVLRDPYTQKPYVQFYTTKRVGGDVVNFQAIKFMKFAA